MPNDVGKFVGRYLQALGCLSIAQIIVSPIFKDGVNIDFSLIFLFWAAHYLIKHSPTARKWTIGVCMVFLVSLFWSFIDVLIHGTRGYYIFLGYRVEHPSHRQFFIATGVLTFMVTCPLLLLLTPQARREFRQPDYA